MEAILLDTAHQHAVEPDKVPEEQHGLLRTRFNVQPADMKPRVYFRITDNWLDLTVRFLVSTHGVRDAKDDIARRIVDELDEAGITIASATYDIVGFPPIEIRRNEIA